MRKQIEEELLHREIDRATTAEESARVRELTANHPELKARYDDLVRLAHTLGRVGQVEPPPGLVDEVMRTVRGRPRPIPRPESWLGTLRTAFGRQPVLRYSFTFALGLALGVLVIAVAGRSSLPRAFGTSMSGTILPDGRLDRLETVDRERFALGGLGGEVTTRVGDDRVLAEIRIDSGRAEDVVLEFDGSVFAPLGFERSGAEGEVALGPHELRLKRAGEGRYVLVLGVSRHVSSPLRLVLSGDGGRLEKTLKTRREGS